MGFHKRKINRGIYGELSKVQEELEEAIDAEEQGQDLMLMIELSDMIGAIEGVGIRYGVTLEQLIKFSKLRKEVAIEELKNIENKINNDYINIDNNNTNLRKNIIMILPDYKCDKDCPYCISKQSKLEKVNLDLDKFKDELKMLKDLGENFKYFVLSGNGEPSFYSESCLKKIRNIVESSGIFEDFRIQTSGNLFKEDNKWDLFKNWTIEITRAKYEGIEDRNLLGYKEEYMNTTNYTESKIRLNLVALKDNLSDLKKVLLVLNEPKHNNIIELDIKILDNINSNWVEDNAVSYNSKEFFILLEFLRVFNRSLRAVRMGTNKEYVWRLKSGIKVRLKKDENYVNNKFKINKIWYGDSFIED